MGGVLHGSLAVGEMIRGSGKHQGLHTSHIARAILHCSSPYPLKASACNRHFHQQTCSANTCTLNCSACSLFSMFALRLQALLVVDDLPDVAACFQQQQLQQRPSEGDLSNSRALPDCNGTTNVRPPTNESKQAAPESAPASGSASCAGAGTTPDLAALAASAALKSGAAASPKAAGTQPKSESNASAESAATSGHASSPSPNPDTLFTDLAPAPERLEFLVPPPPHVTQNPSHMFKALGIGKLSECISTRCEAQAVMLRTKCGVGGGGEGAVHESSKVRVAHAVFLIPTFNIHIR